MAAILGFAALAAGARVNPELAASIPTVEIRGVPFPAEARNGDALLALRGGALVRHRGFKVYTGALYLPEGTPPAEALDEKEPKRLELYYHRSIPREDIIEAAMRTMGRNPKLKRGALRERLDAVHALFQDVREGDRYALVFEPGRGSELFFNGTSRGVIEGDDFMRAYFGIWIGDHPIKEEARDRMLGIKR